MKRQFNLSVIYFSVLILLSYSARGQDLGTYMPAEELHGKIKSITSQRTYLVYKGVKIDPQTEVLSKQNYSEDGKLIQNSTFGNGEERTVYEWSGESYTASIQYFDSNGTPEPKLSSSFKPSVNEIIETGLCPDYTTRTYDDTNANIKREIQLCRDNSIRRSTTIESTRDNYVLKVFIEDSKGRTFEIKNKYGVNFAYLGFIYTVNDLVRPPFWQEMTVGDQRKDDQNNVISQTVTSTDSLHPGQVRYQYTEENKILYYDQ